MDGIIGKEAPLTCASRLQFFRYISERWPLISQLVQDNRIPEFGEGRSLCPLPLSSHASCRQSVLGHERHHPPL